MFKKAILVFVALFSFALNAQNYRKHKVVQGETITQIAHKYNCTPSEIFSLNPDAQNGIQPDAVIIIPNAKTTLETADNSHLVAPKETLYSISKLYSVSIEELQNANPTLISEGLKAGQNLVIPNKSLANLNVASANKPLFDKPLSTLIKSTASSKKELVFLLPFNISKIENDTVNTLPSKLKKDKFLNMTLDFYSGVLMAIDSAKTIGLNIDIKIYDSEETKNTSSIPSLIQQRKFDNTSAIIGPFYQFNIDVLAQSLGTNPISILSPLSKETGKSSNIYQSMPTNDDCKAAMMNYIFKNNGNLIALIDSKKAALKDYLKSNNYKNRIVGLNPNGLVVKDSLRKLLVRNKMNYIILDSQKTGFILAATNAMMSLMTDYQLQMVILEPNPTLDFYEIDLNRLVKLKMTYPSIVRENLSPEAEIFRDKYKKINKIFPNQFAIRGFDLAFDTMLRLSQVEDFKTISDNFTTEQIENKFNYNLNSQNTFRNNGIYILNFESDLTLKQASE
jgi:LysM repeat protein